MKERQLERYAADLRDTFKQERHARAGATQRSYTATVSGALQRGRGARRLHGQHAERVSAYGMRSPVVGLRLDEVTRLQFGFLLHDIGKVAVPDAILYKPDRLTARSAR